MDSDDFIFTSLYRFELTIITLLKIFNIYLQEALFEEILITNLNIYININIIMKK